MTDGTNIRQREGLSQGQKGRIFAYPSYSARLQEGSSVSKHGLLGPIPAAGE